MAEDDDEYEVLERHELSEDEDDVQYETVEGVEEEENEEEEDFRAALASLQEEHPVRVRQENRVETQVRPEVVDDFIRNFLIKVGMERTLEHFNSEWYELQSKGKLRDEYLVPDIYLKNQELDEKVLSLQQQVDKMRIITEKAQGTWNKFRKERDIHRMHHRRVVQEKNKLTNDLARLRKHYLSYEPTLKDLQRKYEVAMKEKMLMRLERDRFKARIHSVEAELKQVNPDQDINKLQSPTKARQVSHAKNRDSTENVIKNDKKFKQQTTKKQHHASPPDSKLPASGSITNPYLNLAFDPPAVERYQLRKSFRAHLNSVSAAAFHPHKAILATVSDDMTWKLWSVPNCDLVMSGEGHRDWVAGVDFHPAGTHLATSSGDKTVKVWNFSQANCALTFTDHTQAVWDTKFHHTGDFLASCSMDHTARLWDLSSARCRQSFRGHVDSVNAISWIPFSNQLCTASGDKTVSIWDARTALCAQTFYGHTNACNSVAVSNRGDILASCDADGILKLWDIRTVSEIGSIQVSQHPCNKIAFDRSNSRIITASDDGLLRAFATDNLQDQIWCGRGHEDAVQSAIFDPADTFIISTSTDCTFRIWS